MADSMADHDVRQRALDERAMRVRLFVRDGIRGDLIEASRAAMRALAPSGDQPKREAIPRRRSVVVGERIGESVVGPCVGRHRNQSRLYEVSCAGCGCVQVRTSGSINFALRRSRAIECPRCLAERRGGSLASRLEAFRERARIGGPVWTTGEVMWLRESVQTALVEAFGEPVDPDDAMPVPLKTAAGWPHSADECMNSAFRFIERAEVERMKAREREERKEAKRRIAVGKEAAKLLAAVEEGDARAMLDVLSELQ